MIRTVRNFFLSIFQKKQSKPSTKGAKSPQLKKIKIKSVIITPHGKRYVFKRTIRTIHTVFIHCSASDNPEHDNIATIKQWHLDRGFKQVGYHYFIRKDGVLELGRSLEDKPAAQGNLRQADGTRKDFNYGTIAICLHGNDIDKFTDDQFSTLIILCNKINKKYDGDIKFRGHCEVNAKKKCPVFDYKALLSINNKGYIPLI